MTEAATQELRMLAMRTNAPVVGVSLVLRYLRTRNTQANT